jgi:hypothetical protein
LRRFRACIGGLAIGRRRRRRGARIAGPAIGRRRRRAGARIARSAIGLRRRCGLRISRPAIGWRRRRCIDCRRRRRGIAPRGRQWRAHHRRRGRIGRLGRRRRINHRRPPGARQQRQSDGHCGRNSKHFAHARGPPGRAGFKPRGKAKPDGLPEGHEPADFGQVPLADEARFLTGTHASRAADKLAIRVDP